MITFQGREQPYAYLLTFLAFIYLLFFLLTDIRISGGKLLTPEQMRTEWLMNFAGASAATIFQVVFVLLVSNKLQQNLLSSTEQLQGKNMELTKLSLIAKKTKNGVVITDHQGRIEWVNDAFTEMSGYTLQEVMGKKPKDFLQKADDRSEALDLLTKKLQNREFVKTTIVNYKKDGTPYYNQLEINPVFDDQHTHTNFISIQRDITEQLQLEKTIIDQKLNEQKLITEITIQSQEKEKSELGAELHDNINQILAAAKMYLDLYAAKLPAPEPAIEKSHYNIDLALQEIRKLSHSLVTPTLGNRDLSDAIKDLVSDLTQAAGIEIVYHNNLSEGIEITDTRKLVLYR
ncbi:MAG: PAS domain-containing protein, partial [Bacteroidota bacterium]